MVTAKVVILIGGYSTGTRFRPLSLNRPKQLFPVAGYPMIYHEVKACTKIQGLQEVILLGFYKEAEFADFVKKTREDLNISVRYLQEESESGTGGGLYQFQDEILKDNPDFVFVLSSDICCAFPLQELLDFTVSHPKRPLGTLLGKQVPAEEANVVGCMVVDDSLRLVHTVEKPTTFISDIINAGLYCFSKEIFRHLNDSFKRRREREAAVEAEDLLLDPRLRPRSRNYLSLELDVLVPLAGQEDFYVYMYPLFWRQLKSAGTALYANEFYMKQYSSSQPSLLTPLNPNKPKGVEFVGNSVILHPTAVVGAGCKIGPNVYVGAGTVVGKGVRLSHTIVEDNCLLHDRCSISWAILAQGCVVGSWTRIEGFPRPELTMDRLNPKDRKDITILGEDATVVSEITVTNCVVMPHKTLTSSASDEILL